MTNAKKPFNSDLVLEERISEATLRAYNVGFDQNKFRLEPLVDLLADVIPEFSLGFHEGTQITLSELRQKLKEAATRVYTTEKYKKRGEFGELILHLLLRDYHGTIPLISKIYFKDADNVTVHGFDGVHVVSEEDGTKKLWLGESKLYKSGKDGVKELAKDLVNHLQADYLRREFSLLETRLPEGMDDIEHWRRLFHRHRKLDEVMDNIVIPMVCTYSSDLYKNHNDNTAEFLNDFVNECKELEKVFLDKKIETDVEVILMLLPVEDKDLLIQGLDTRLKHMQVI